jgi:hypothetical protein
MQTRFPLQDLSFHHKKANIKGALFVINHYRSAHNVNVNPHLLPNLSFETFLEDLPRLNLTSREFPF